MKGAEEADSHGQKRAIAASPDNKPSAKRSRVSRACDQCRASREKCDGTQPTCQTCISQRRDCTYHEQPKKRGIQPNYIRTLELTLAWLFQTYPQSASLLASKLPVEADGTHRIVAGKNGTGAEELHTFWRNSLICRQIDQILSGSTVERLDGATTQPEQSREHHLEARTEAPLYSQHAFHLDSGLDTRPIMTGTFRQRLPSNAWTLLEYYFAFTHSWLPITDKQELLKLMYNFPVDGIAPHEADNAPYSELWSVLALAATQMHLAGCDIDSAHLKEAATSSIPTERERFQLSHVKALLLLGLLEMTNESYLTAWLLVGSAVRLITAMTATHGYLASDVAFRDLVNRAGMSASTVASVKLVTLAAFVLETSLAVRLGATPHLRPDQMSSIGLLHEEGLEEWSPWHDPLQDQALSTKSPSRAFSTLNKVVMLAMDAFPMNRHLGSNANAIGQRIEPQHDQRATMPTGDGKRISSIVSALVKNAAQTNRLQPMHVVAQSGVLAPIANGFAIAPLHESPLQTRDHNQLQQSVGYMSIPTHDSTETGNSNTSPAFASNDILNTSTDMWQSEVPGGAAASSTNEADIFEELAMLERTVSSSHPQFMQNLGFAPDVDLAEFFGADYQPSDPLLAYMQPSLYNAGAGASQSNTEFG